MKPIEAVHTFARHCCLNRLAALKQEYDQAKAAGADKDVTYGCRRLVLQAILVEVERLTPADFRSRGHAAARLMETAQFGAKPIYRAEVMAKASLSARDAGRARSFYRQPAPIRRAKGLETLARRAASLSAHPAAGGKSASYGNTAGTLGDYGQWWVPFEKYEFPYELIVLDSRAVRDQLGYAALQQILARRDIPRVYELWEFGREPDREMELSLWKPTSAWPERYWCTDELDWLLYATHENSTTIAGDWLLREIKAAWPDWQAYTWIAPWPNPSWTG